MNATLQEHVALATAAGFTAAAENAERNEPMIQRVIRAQSLYASITQRDIDAFNAELKSKTFREDKRTYRETWKELVFTPINQYASMPPMEILAAVRDARETGLFDKFEVAYIATRERVRDPDPIVFGRIEGCPDRFFIAQWDEDVRLADILVAGMETEAP